jgi:uncharacterized protein YecE (DUF72 family)
VTPAPAADTTGMALLYAGTSGFAYPDWKPGFYPPDLPGRRFLEHYSSRLNCVEINYTFRRAPSASTLRSWVEHTPGGFVFAVKAHQRITHARRLKDAEEPLDYFLRTLEPLRAAGRLGPILLQLPPALEADVPRLAGFLPLLPRELRFTVEFRHVSWFTEEVYGLLREHGVALCLAESETLETPTVITADLVYHRLRRPGYTAEDLERFAGTARASVRAGRDVYMLFKHEEDPQGALDAERLLAVA